MRLVLAFTFFFNFTWAAGPGESAPPASNTFRISTSELPKTMDPHLLRSSSGAFLTEQLYRNFYSYDDQKGFVPELGEGCVKKKLKWTCTLKKDLVWSDGSALNSQDFVLSFRRIVTISTPRSDLLFNIQNAREISEQTKSSETLGVRAIDARTFEITWVAESPDNDVVLMSPLFVPLPDGQYKKDVFSGPYQVADQNNQRVLLAPNKLYFKKNDRPMVEFTVFEENLAVKAYEKKQLDFLKRLPTAQIPDLQKLPDFHWYYVLRLDSIAFGPELRSQKKLREDLTQSLAYGELQELYHSEGRPGCTGLPEHMSSEVCYTEKKVKPLKTPQSLAYSYSTAGGDDHRRLAEWLQSQWLKKLNLTLNLQPLENKIFQETVEKNPPAIFRKGFNLETPTCYNALKVFTSSNDENFIQLKDKKFDALVERLRLVSAAKEQKKLCRQGLKMLMDQHLFIPTGRIHFAVLVNPVWRDWKLNELNHLDLSELSQSLQSR